MSNTGWISPRPQRKPRRPAPPGSGWIVLGVMWILGSVAFGWATWRAVLLWWFAGGLRAPAAAAGIFTWLLIGAVMIGVGLERRRTS